MRIDFLTRFLCSFCFVINITYLQAQDQEQEQPKEYNFSPLQNFQAPNVATFNTYGAIPVSLYTGTPNVDIPLYTIKEDKLEIPIELRYNINNVKPNIHPGVVGLGWNLFAGGNITRIQRGGYHDEIKFYNSSLGKTVKGYLENENILSDVWSNGSKNTLWYSQERLHLEAETINFTDFSPDKFIFNFLGYSGAFYRTHEGKWMIDSETNFEVNHNLIIYENCRAQISEGIGHVYAYFSSGVGRCRTIEMFTLTAPDGSIFEFGGINAIDYSMGLFNQASKDNLPIATTWHLSKIILPNKKKISFDYKIADPIYEGNYNFWIQSRFENSTNARGLTFQLIMPVLLTSITLPDLQKVVEFEYKNSIELEYPNVYFDHFYGNSSDGAIDLRFHYWYWGEGNKYTQNFASFKWSQLSKLKILNSPEYIFEYTNSPKERLKLKSFYQVSKATNKLKKYEFSYNTDTLPAYLSGHYDHLGFYNGEDFSFTYNGDFYFELYDTSVRWKPGEPLPKNPNAIKILEANGQKFYNSRKGDKTGTYVSAETLNKITYPTGGFSVFEYEPNEVASIISENRRGWSSFKQELQYPGGLRIKRITNYTTNNMFANAKRYYYVNNFNLKTKTGTCSGILAFTPKYYWNLKVYDVDPESKEYTQSLHEYDLKVLSSGSTNQAYYNLENAPFVCYPQVIECMENSNREIQGYTKYIYSSFNNDTYDDWPLASLNNAYKSPVVLSPYTPFSSNAKKRGKLILKEIYDSNNKLQSGEYNKYAITPIKSLRNITLHRVRTGSGTNYDYTRWSLGGSSIIKIYENLLSEKTSKTIAGSDTVINTVNFEYNTENLLSKEIKTINRSQKEESVVRYSGDLFRDNNYINSPTYSYMAKNNMLNYPVEYIKYMNGRVVSAEILNYSSTILLDRRIIYPSEQYLMETEIPLSDYQPVKIDNELLKVDNRCKLFSTFETYNNFGLHNFLEINKSKTIYLWSYTGRYPIAEIKNATIEDVINTLNVPTTYINELTLKIAPTEDDWNKINSLRYLLPKALVSTYKYKPFVGMQTATDPRGVITYYEYDPDGKLREAFIIINGMKKEVTTYDYHFKTNN